MTVRFVGGGGVRTCVFRMAGPGSGIMSVSSAPACVLGGALAGGGGGASAGGNVTVRCASAGVVITNKNKTAFSRDAKRSTVRDHCAITWLWQIMVPPT